jgi:hypothetical protein
MCVCFESVSKEPWVVKHFACLLPLCFFGGRAGELGRGGEVLAFELRASPLLGRCSTTQATPPALFCVLGIFEIGFHEFA